MQYQRKGRSAGRNEFVLSSSDLRQWFAGQEIPPEFEGPEEGSRVGLAGVTPDRAVRWARERLGMSNAEAVA